MYTGFGGGWARKDKSWSGGRTQPPKSDTLGSNPMCAICFGNENSPL